MKISALCAQLDVVAFDHSVERIVRRAAPGARRRGGGAPAGVRQPRHGGVRRPAPHRRRVHAACSTSRRSELDAAGIVVQAYLPDAHDVLEHLGEWARRPRRGRRRADQGAHRQGRQPGDGAGRRRAARLGAGAVRRPRPRPTPATSGCSTRRCDRRGRARVRVGVASHNLFDVAWALVLRDRAAARPARPARDRDARGDGPGAGPRRAGRRRRAAAVLPDRARRRARRQPRLPRPALRREHRAGELPAGDVPHAPALGGSGASRRRASGRRSPSGARCPTAPRRPAVAADVAAALAAGRVRQRARHRLHRRRDARAAVLRRRRSPRRRRRTARSSTTSAGSTPSSRRAVGAAAAGRRAPSPSARAVLRAVADGDGRRAAGGDRGDGRRGRQDGARGRPGGQRGDRLRPLRRDVAPAARRDRAPLGVVVVAAPWNFPYAIPAGGVFAALMAGNAVILKPAPETRRTAWLLVAAVLARRRARRRAAVRRLPRRRGRAAARHPSRRRRRHPHRCVRHGASCSSTGSRGCTCSPRPAARTRSSSPARPTSTWRSATSCARRSATPARSARPPAWLILDAAVYDDGRSSTRLADAVRTLRRRLAGRSGDDDGPADRAARRRCCAVA